MAHRPRGLSRKGPQSNSEPRGMNPCPSGVSPPRDGRGTSGLRIPGGSRGRGLRGPGDPLSGEVGHPRGYPGVLCFLPSGAHRRPGASALAGASVRALQDSDATGTGEQITLDLKPATEPFPSWTSCRRSRCCRAPGLFARKANFSSESLPCRQRRQLVQIR